MLGEISIEQAICKEAFDCLDVIPSNVNLAGAEIDLSLIHIQMCIRDRDKLEDAIKELFFSGNLELNEDIYIANQRQKQLLIEAKEAFLLVKDGIESGMSEDFLTIDLMTAYEKLGYIIGEEVEDDLADKIFKSFCMGK